MWKYEGICVHNHCNTVVLTGNMASAKEHREHLITETQSVSSTTLKTLQQLTIHAWYDNQK